MKDIRSNVPPVKSGIAHKVGSRAALRKNPKLLFYSRKMRDEPTRAEAMLWERLSKRQQGARFRRQAIIGGRIADFYCPALALVIEVDGGYHSDPRTEIADRIRESHIGAFGMRIIRFTNEEVINSIETVLFQIRTTLGELRIGN